MCTTFKRKYYMKKIILFAVALSAVLSSCSKSEVVDNGQDTASKEISFSSYASVATKAVEEVGFEANDVFVVEAYETGDLDFNEVGVTYTPFMENQVVTAVSNSELTSDFGWEYSPIKVWPLTDKVSYFAVTTADGDDSHLFDETTMSADVAPSFTYSNPSSSAAQKDLMVASALNRTEPTDKTSNVALIFNHVLTQVKFTAATAVAYDDATVVTINSLTVDFDSDNYIDKGSFTFSPTSESEGSWSNLVVAEDAVSEEFTLNEPLSTEASSIGSTFMIIPQGDGVNSVATVTIDYNVTTTDVDNQANSSDINNVATFYISEALAQNKIYVYNIQISLSAIHITGSVTTEWGDDTEFEVEVNNNSIRQ